MIWSNAKDIEVRLIHKRNCALLFLGFAVLSCCSFTHAETPGRRYGDGPLKREHFKAPVPSDSTLDAVVYTRLNYSYKFRSSAKDGAVELTCTTIVCCSEQMPDRSWMRDSAKSELLDHEQGHLDLAEVVARKAEARLRYLVRTGKLKAQGTTKEAAEAALARTVRAQFMPFDRELTSVNDEYDRVTSHGRDKDAQKAERRSQKRLVRKLSTRRKPTLTADENNAVRQ